MNRPKSPLSGASPDVPQLWITLAASLFAVAVTGVVAVAGYLPPRIFVAFAVIVAASVAGGFLLNRSGMRMGRPGTPLTVAYLALAALAISYVIYSAEEAQASIVAIYLVAFMFGVLTLDAWPLVGVAAFYWLCFLGAIIARQWLRPGSIDLHRAGFALVVYFMLLAWFTALGIYVGSLRRKLRDATGSMAAAMAELQNLARIDSLTGCYNRRHAMELFALEVKRAQRGRPLSVGLLDLDHFKDINDTYGHQAGDDALRTLAVAVQPLLRATDALARYGGEEFLLLLSQTPGADALGVCERVRKRIEDTRLDFLPKQRRITVSLGMAEHRNGDTLEQTLKRADAALYEAKRSGRNCVVAAP